MDDTGTLATQMQDTHTHTDRCNTGDTYTHVCTHTLFMNVWPAVLVSGKHHKGGQTTWKKSLTSNSVRLPMVP